MGRTASPVTPGTTPTPEAAAAGPAADGVNDEAAVALVSEGLRAETAETEVEQLRREMAEMRALVIQMSKNQVTATAAPVELPTMAATLKKSPTVPVLTAEGWYVPAVHPTDRKA